MKKLQDAYRDANDLAIVLELKPSGAVTDIFLFPFNGKRPRSSFLARTRITRLVEDSELDSIDPKLGIHCFKFALMLSHGSAASVLLRLMRLVLISGLGTR